MAKSSLDRCKTWLDTLLTHNISDSVDCLLPDYHSVEHKHSGSSSRSAEKDNAETKSTTFQPCGYQSCASKGGVTIPQYVKIEHVISTLEKDLIRSPVDALRKLVVILQSCDSMWLFETECFDENRTEQQAIENKCEHYESLYIRLSQKLFAIGTVKEFNKTKETELSSEDFIGVAEKSSLCMNCYWLMLLHFSKIREHNATDTHPFVEKIIFSFVNKGIYVCLEHFPSNLVAQPWADESSQSSSQILLKQILITCGCKTLEEFLSGSNYKKMFPLLFSEMKPRLQKKNWKQNPTVQCSFTTCLMHLKFPCMSDYLDTVLPPCLLFLDDFQVENKVVGVKCLQHVVDNVSSAELGWYGRAEVMYNSLQQQLHTQDAQLLKVLLPCLLSVLKVVEASPLNIDKPREESKYDDILQRILTSMLMENKLENRMIYAEFLNLYVKKMGVTVVKHFKKLFHVVFTYLETYDGNKQSSRVDTLDCLKVVMQETWPRISCRSDKILRSLLRLLVDITAESSLVTKDLKVSLTQKVTENIVLLVQIDPTVQQGITTFRDLPFINDECKIIVEDILKLIDGESQEHQND